MTISNLKKTIGKLCLEYLRTGNADEIEHWRRFILYVCSQTSTSILKPLMKIFSHRLVWWLKPTFSIVELRNTSLFLSTVLNSTMINSWGGSIDKWKFNRWIHFKRWHRIFWGVTKLSASFYATTCQRRRKYKVIRWISRRAAGRCWPAFSLQKPENYFKECLIKSTARSLYYT